MKCANAECSNQVQHKGDHLCQECVSKLVRKINSDRWILYQAQKAMEAQSS